uniref:FP protein C-terminal domain-containing protein n=1 Tax=Cacopsylla melanoneura TaxID=428564 RepID=A0A8D8YDL7_9HEMI
MSGRGKAGKTASQKNEVVRGTRNSKLKTPPIEFDDSEIEEDEDQIGGEFGPMEKTITKLMNEFKKDMKKEFNESRKQMKNEMNEFQESLEFNHSKLDEIIAKMGNMQKTMNKMTERQDQLEKENKELKVQLKELKYTVEDLQQYTRNRNVQIDGIPSKQDEDLRMMMKNIGEKIEVKILDSDIDKIHRIPTKSTNNPEPIVVQFTTRRVRDEIVKKAKEKKPCTNDLQMQCTNRNIYVNEHLTPQKKQILYEAKKIKEEKQYKFLWCKNGKIFVRKDEKSMTIHLNSREDLNKII